MRMDENGSTFIFFKNENGSTFIFFKDENGSTPTKSYIL